MQSKRLEYLFLLYYQNKASDSEKAELAHFLEQDAYQEQIHGLITHLIQTDDTDHTLSQGVTEDILTSIFQSTTSAVEDEKKNPVKKLAPWKFWLAAATVSGLSLWGAYSWTQTESQPALTNSTVTADVPPGQDRATLALWDGTVINLDSGMVNPVSKNWGIEINAKKGELISGQNVQSQGFNTLSTPWGGQYKLILPDGSQAWLNAGSSIRFPTAFTGNQRSVSITGEVYFEIQPNKAMPFTVQLADKKVNGNHMEVTVLGTHFNISSYADDPSINTTLMEGAVEVKQGNQKKVLRPGQQARVSHSPAQSEIFIEKVDTQGIIAWKEGRFEFNGSIQDIMKQIARWYNVQVKYEGDADQKAFTGVISRETNISDVLNMLELTGEIQFSIQKGTIVVKPVH